MPIRMALALACAACTPVPQAGEGASVDDRCSIDARDTGELSRDEICAIFAPLLAAHPDLRLDIVMPRSSRVDVALRDAGGNSVASRAMSVSDRGAYAGLWQQIAGELERELTGQPQG